MASRGLNKVMLIGNLGADPETRYTAGGAAITNVRIATSEQWKDKSSGENQERTEWHRIVFFGRLAEIAAEYLRKGSQIYVEGSIRTNKWQNKEGVDQYTTEIIASEMQMLGSRGGSGGSASSGAGNSYDQSAPSRAPNKAPGKGAPAAPPPSDDFDDDIPF